MIREMNANNTKVNEKLYHSQTKTGFRVCPVISKAQGEMFTYLFGTSFTDFLRKTEFVPTQYVENLIGWQWLNSSNSIIVTSFPGSSNLSASSMECLYIHTYMYI